MCQWTSSVINGWRSSALAQPQWTRPGQQVTLWIDNSPSLLLREDGGTRLDLGWALARTQLAERPGTEVQVSIDGLAPLVNVYGG